MTRYIAIGRKIQSTDWSDYKASDRIDVIVCDDAPVDTGLVDHNGTKLYKFRERHPIGFAVTKEK